MGGCWLDWRCRWRAAGGSHERDASKTWQNGNDPFEDVWLVPANGTARLLLQHVVPSSKRRQPTE
jgi:hypothetical protein